MCVHVAVYVFVWQLIALNNFYCILFRGGRNVCVCVRFVENLYVYSHTHKHTYLYIQQDTIY